MEFEKPEFITIDPKQDKIDLIKKYQEDTGTVLYPAQDAMILINLMVYYANLVKSQVQEAACLNLAQFSRYPVLDFLGKYKNCERISASSGKDELKITLNTVFTYDVTISKGFQVKTSDGAYIFETTKDLIIPSGESTGTVEIKSQEGSEDVNKYKAGEINTVITSTYSFIESVENLNGVTGGADDEDDDSYIERILLAPEGFSVAGPEGAYIYFAKSAHADITDVSVEVPEENITVDIDGTTLEMTSNSLENDSFSVTADYQSEQAAITLKKDIPSGSVITVKIPHPYKITLYVLTKDGEAPQTVLDKVSETLRDVRPLCDYVIVKSAEVKTFEISGDVYLTKNADLETVQTSVNGYLNDFINDIKGKLNRDVVKNKIITEVCKLSDVYDFNLTSLAGNLAAAKNISYDGSIGIINYIKTDKES